MADSHGVDPLTTLKSIQNHLSNPHMLGFLKRTDRNRGESGGQYYEYSLNFDADIVLAIRDEIETERTRRHTIGKTDETYSLTVGWPHRSRSELRNGLDGRYLLQHLPRQTKRGVSPGPFTIIATKRFYHLPRRRRHGGTE